MQNKPVFHNLMSEFINCYNFDVLAKKYTFQNQITGTIWQLSIKDRTIIVDVPNFSFQLLPVNSNKFKPVNPEIKLEFEFEKAASDERWTMYIYAKSIKRATFVSC